MTISKLTQITSHSTKERLSPFRKHPAHNSPPNPIQRKHKKTVNHAVYRKKVNLVDPNIPMNYFINFDNLNFVKRKEGELRIVTWNVQGIPSAQKKGMGEYLKAEQADIVVITETFTGDPNLPVINNRYPHRYWGKMSNGHGGIAILSKIKPISVKFGLPTLLTTKARKDSVGRIITLEFENTYLIGTYVPHVMSGRRARIEWNAAFEIYLRQLDSKKPVIWGGDLNVCPTSKDTPNFGLKYDSSACCLKFEIDGFNSQLQPSAESGHEELYDVWRKFHPSVDGSYTQFSRLNDCRRLGMGYRLDYFIASKRIFNRVKQCEIRYEIYGPSDHLPVIMDLEGVL